MKPFIPFLVFALMFSNIMSVQCLDYQKMLKLCNDERKKAGAPPLSYNDALCKVAHSNYMAKNHILTHDNPAGDLGSRFEQHGYSYSCAGENVAEGYHDEISIMKGWMKSSGHRANILNPSFKDAGFGESRGYWTQDFGSGGKHSGQSDVSHKSPTKQPHTKPVHTQGSLKHGASPPPPSYKKIVPVASYSKFKVQHQNSYKKSKSYRLEYDY
ncbi:CAP domain-containing protein [Gigaspora margarita]|uniref:CAP domain-containing protein n=1 Tax=Gigaspora margarita TaxID=4874 RepID=A0A8H3XG65_GIGMA|nr:CAP domain-containing protein [Gigaspora margarita]